MKSSEIKKILTFDQHVDQIIDELSLCEEDEICNELDLDSDQETDPYADEDTLTVPALEINASQEPSETRMKKDHASWTRIKKDAWQRLKKDAWQRLKKGAWQRLKKEPAWSRLKKEDSFSKKPKSLRVMLIM